MAEQTNPWRELTTGQVARVHVHDAVTGDDVVVHEDSQVLLEAPNWSRDGTALYLNGRGRLFSLAPEPGAALEEIPHENLPPINNDHVLDPDGEHVFLSAADGHIHRAPLAGGRAERITRDDGVWHFLHGVSPDGSRLAYVRMRSFAEPGRLAIINATGGESRIVDTGSGHIDGPEWSPDGEWLLFNSEHWASAPGHAQLARIREDGSGLERLVASDTVDWFPHVSPDGALAVYLEFPTGTTGHPADLDVALVVVATSDWRAPLRRIRMRGGQGTINVPSWAPDSRRFAYVAY